MVLKLLSRLFKKELLQLAVQDLFNTIGKDDILQEKSGEWYLAGKPLIKGRKEIIIAEAHTWINSKLWEVLRRDIQYQANKLMFEKSKTELDLISGKLWLYTLDVIKTRIESLAQEKGNFIT